MYIGDYQIMMGDVIALVTYDGDVYQGVVTDIYHWATSYDDAVVIQLQSNTGTYDFDDKEIRQIEYLGSNRDYEN